MNELLQNLIKLQSLEFEETTEKTADPAIAELRGKIPPQILGHYDRLVAHGKKGLAAVRDQVCTGCHMQVPIGVITTLMHDKDIQLCEVAADIFIWRKQRKAEAPKPAAKPGPAKKPRKQKVPCCWFDR